MTASQSKYLQGIAPLPGDLLHLMTAQNHRLSRRDRDRLRKLIERRKAMIRAAREANNRACEVGMEVRPEPPFGHF